MECGLKTDLSILARVIASCTNLGSVSFDACAWGRSKVNNKEFAPILEESVRFIIW